MKAAIAPLISLASLISLFFVLASLLLWVAKAGPTAPVPDPTPPVSAEGQLLDFPE